MIVIMLLFLYVLPIDADSAQSCVSVEGVQRQYYVTPIHRNISLDMHHAYHQGRLFTDLKMQQRDHEIKTKYYTDPAYCQQIKIFCELIYQCNSPDELQRIVARNKILHFQLPGVHQHFIQKIQSAVAARYFDKNGKFYNAKEDASFGRVTVDFFKCVFNYEDYLEALNKLHDEYSLGQLEYETQGLCDRLLSSVGYVFSKVPHFVKNFNLPKNLEKARNNSYNKKLIGLIEDGQQEAYNQFRMNGVLPNQIQAVESVEQAANSKMIDSPNLSKECEQNINIKNDDFFLQYLPKERVNFYEEALQETAQTTRWQNIKYELSDNIEDLLKEFNLDPAVYRMCLGYQFQQLLHQECLTILDKSINVYRTLKKAYPFLIKSIVSNVDLGREHNQLGFMQKAVMFLSISWALLERAQEINQDILLGVRDGIVDVATNVYDVLQDPKGTLNNIVQTAYTLADIAEKVLDTGLNYSGRSPQEREILWQKRLEKIADTAEHLKKKLFETPIRDLARFGTSATVETILFEKTLTTLAKCFRQGVQELSNLADKIKKSLPATEVVATTAEGVAVETRVTKDASKQLMNAAESVGEKIKSGLKVPTKRILPAGATLEQLPMHIVDLIKGAETYFMQLVTVHEKEIMAGINRHLPELMAHLKARNISCEWLKNIKINAIDFKHVLIGDLNKGSLSGLHSTLLCPKKIEKVVIQPGKRGTWMGKWFEPCALESKTSSFFPSIWNEKIITEKVIESIKNTVEIQFKENKLFVGGFTAENIGITVVINKHGCIESFFPAIKINGVKCIP